MYGLIQYLRSTLVIYPGMLKMKKNSAINKGAKLASATMCMAMVVFVSPRSYAMKIFLEIMRP